MKTAILISGRGSNMEVLINASKAPDFPVDIVLVLSNRADAQGLKIAEAAGIATDVVDHKVFKTRESFDDAVDERLREAGAEFICLAGFMRILGEQFIRAWPDHIINVHPSLLPAYRGLHTHRRVLEDGVRITGCTVHFVRPELDDGPIIAQAAVPVLPGDTEDSLAGRILTWEHKIYPQALKAVASGCATVDGDNVVVDGAVSDNVGFISPIWK